MTDPLLGKIIGAYRIDWELSPSRWGKVYRAWQNATHRAVALKVMSPEIAALPGKIDQFRDRARGGAQLSHGNLVAIYEAGYVQGVHFCAMELMDGPPLEQFLRKSGKVDEHHLLLAIVSVARALDYLWQRQFPHQPPQAGNVLTARSGTVKLINFEPDAAPPSQTQRDDIVALGLLLGQLANDISPVSKPVGELVERMVGATGRKPLATLGELAEVASALDHELFPSLPAPAPVIEKANERKTKPILIAGVALALVAFLVLLVIFLMRRTTK